MIGRCYGSRLAGAVLVLFALFVASSTILAADEGAGITQKEFATLLFSGKQLEGRFPNASTAADKIKVLNGLGYAPVGGYVAQKELTLGDFSFVMVKVLNYSSLLPENPQPADYIKVLAKDAIVKEGDPSKVMTRNDVIEGFKKVSFPTHTAVLPDYERPMSPLD